MNRKLEKKIIINFLCLIALICGIFIGQVKAEAATVTVSFNTHGGSSVADITGTSGSMITAPTAPTLTGYTFAGWYKDAARKNAWNFSVDTLQEKDITLHADWVINTYTVAFDSQGGSLVTSKSGTYDSTITAPIVPTRTGYTFGGWYKEAACTNVWNFPTDTIPANNVTLYAKWSANTYTIAFDSQSGSVVASQIGVCDSTITAPIEPTKTGYTFGGWYKEAACTNAWNFSTDTVPANNLMLYAKWMINTYTIAFDSQDGSEVISQTGTYDSTITVPAEPTKTGYTFSGWYKEAECTNAWNFTTDKISANNITLYAKWTVNTYIVAFDSQGGSLVISKTGEFYSIIEEPTAPTRTGYTFGGWYKDTACTDAWNFTIDTVPANNITLYAKWSANTYTVVFDSQGGSVVASQIGTFDRTIVEPSVPTKTGYTFGGWYKEAACTDAWYFTADKIPANNVTLYAKWTINTYTIAFDSQGGSAVSSQTVNYDSTITVPVAPTRTGYTFSGWYKEAELTNVWNFTTDKIPANNVTIYAKWTVNSYTVAFDSQGGSAVSSQTVNYDSAITVPVAPTRTGYTFSEWHKEAELTNVWNFATDKIPANNVTLYAKWTINTYTIAFDSQGGSAVSSQIGTFDSTIAEPAEPTKTGFTFGGWYRDSECKNAWNFSLDTVPASSVTLYGKWTINTYTIAFDSQGGSAVVSQITNYASPITVPTAPTKTGYLFRGWYKEGACINAWNFTTDTIQANNIKLYAKWIIKTDYTMPVFSGTTNKTIAQNDPFNPLAGVTATDNMDGNITNLINVSGSVNTSVKGVYTLTYTVCDKSENVKTVVRTITVDNTAPTISGTTNKTIALNDSFNPLSGVTATDNLDGNITSRITVTGSVIVSVRGVYTLTYTVSDKSGNIKSVTRTITVDNTAPVISGTANKTIALNSTFNPKAGVTASDNLDGNITNQIRVSGSINYSVKGVYILTYTVSDRSGNIKTVVRTITVDNTAPVISGTANKTIALNTTFNPLSGVTASDNLDGNITSLITFTGSVNVNVKGVYTLTYTVSDRSGNVRTVSRTITVDNTAPVISGAANKTIALNSMFNPVTGVTASDNVDGNITSLISITGSVNVGVKGIYTLTYTVSDKSGNIKTITRTITVDNTAPVISGTANKTIGLNTTFNPLTGVTASDNLDGNITSLITFTGSVNVGVKGVYTLTYTVSDRSGNIKTVLRTITVDNTAPVISGTTNKTIALNSSFNPLTGVTASDNLDGNITNLISVIGSVNVNVKGVYTLTYTVSDRSGNVKTVVRTITVDNAAPVISGATSKTIALNSTFNPLTGVTASDNLDGNITNLISVTGSVNVNVKGVYTLTYTVSDKSGNVKTVNRAITVK